MGRVYLLVVASALLGAPLSAVNCTDGYGALVPDEPGRPGRVRDLASTRVTPAIGRKPTSARDLQSNKIEARREALLDAVFPVVKALQSFKPEEDQKALSAADAKVRELLAGPDGPAMLDSLRYYLGSDVKKDSVRHAPLLAVHNLMTWEVEVAKWLELKPVLAKMSKLSSADAEVFIKEQNLMPHQEEALREILSNPLAGEEGATPALKAKNLYAGLYGPMEDRAFVLTEELLKSRSLSPAVRADLKRFYNLVLEDDGKVPREVYSSYVEHLWELEKEIQSLKAHQLN